jgi:hypothetical protein
MSWALSDLVVLVCPAGAETAPVSQGSVGYQAYPETPGDPRTRWLVQVPRYVAVHFCRVGGFVPLEAG